MEQSPSRQQLVDYLRALAKLHLDVTEERISKKEFAERLAPLQRTHKRMIESGAFPLDMKLPLVNGRARTPKDRHALSFTCQCRTCVRLSTITLQDRDLLKAMGIVWTKRKILKPAKL